MTQHDVSCGPARLTRTLFVLSAALTLPRVALGAQEGFPSSDQSAVSDRLAWDQPASSREELGTLRFLAYVNGQRQDIGSAVCSSDAGPVGFSCSAPVPALAPGTHVVEVAAYVAASPDLEGPRSTPILLRIGNGPAAAAAVGRAATPESTGAAPTDVAPTDAPPTDTAPRDDTARDAAPLDWTSTTSDGVPLRATAIAQGLDDPTDLVPLPDGRLLIAERSGRVRVFREGVLLTDSAAVLDEVTFGDGRGLLALTAGPDFARTGHVFAASTADEGLRVTRFTLFGDRLVDRAVLLEGLPVSAVQPAALLRAGPDGLLYLVLDDAGDPRRVGDLGSYSGKVLRLATDGTVPVDQPRHSPVWSVGVSHPIGLTWNVDPRQPWLVGVVAPGRAGAQPPPGPDADAGGAVVRLSVTPELDATRAIVIGPSAAALRGDLLVASANARAILRVTFGGGTVAAGSEWLFRDLPGPVTALASAADGATYAAVGRLLLRIVTE